MLMIIATQVFFGGKERIFHLRNCDVNMENMKIFSLENLAYLLYQIFAFSFDHENQTLRILFTTIIYRKNSIWKIMRCLRNLNFWRIKNGCQSDSSIKFQRRKRARCLKITDKVSFASETSETSYVYIWSGQKLIKKVPKMVNLASFRKTEACGQTVLPDRSVLIGQKLVENAKIPKFKCDILSNFQTMCSIGRRCTWARLILEVIRRTFLGLGTKCWLAALYNVTWLLMFWCCKKRYIIYKPHSECVSDASRYSTLAPAHWTCMVLQNARKTVEDRRQKSVGGGRCQPRGKQGPEQG